MADTDSDPPPASLDLQRTCCDKYAATPTFDATAIFPPAQCSEQDQQASLGHTSSFNQWSQSCDTTSTGMHPTLSLDSSIDALPVRTSMKSHWSTGQIVDEKVKISRVRQLVSHLVGSLWVPKTKTAPSNPQALALQANLGQQNNPQQAQGFNYASEDAFLSTLTSKLLSVSPSLPTKMNRGPTQWKLSDYLVLEEITQGSSSMVYRCICKLSGEMVTLKVYQMQQLCELGQHQIFREYVSPILRLQPNLAQVRLHSRLQHENIIHLYAAFQQGEAVVLVQEYAGGGDLSTIVKRHAEGIPESVAVQIVLDPFLRVLQYLHRQGIAHRDIKPDSIMFTRTGGLRLCDFGVAIDLREERAVTRAGTLDYMAPEVLQCPHKYQPFDNKEEEVLAYGSGVDAWAVGVMSYELLTGRPAFYSTREDVVERQILQGSPHLPESMSTLAASFISAALSKAAMDRPTISEMVSDPWITAHSSGLLMAKFRSSDGIANQSAIYKSSWEPAMGRFSVGSAAGYKGPMGVVGSHSPELPSSAFSFNKSFPGIDSAIHPKATLAGAQEAPKLKRINSLSAPQAAIFVPSPLLSETATKGQRSFKYSISCEVFRHSELEGNHTQGIAPVVPRTDASTSDSTLLSQMMARALTAEQAGAETWARLREMTARAEGAERDSLDAAILAHDSKKHDSEVADAKIAKMERVMKQQKDCASADHELHMKYDVQLRKMTARAMGAEASGASAAEVHRADLRRMTARAEWAEHGKAHATEAATAAFVGLQQMTARVKEVEEAGIAAAVQASRDSLRKLPVMTPRAGRGIPGADEREPALHARGQGRRSSLASSRGSDAPLYMSAEQLESGDSLLSVGSAERAIYRGWL